MPTDFDNDITPTDVDIAAILAARLARTDTCQCLEPRKCLTLSHGDIARCHDRRNDQSGQRAHIASRWAAFEIKTTTYIIPSGAIVSGELHNYATWRVAS